MNTPTSKTDVLYTAERALHGEMFLVPFEHSPRDLLERNRTLERELAAALEARNAAVRRCAEIVAGLTANRNGVLATIRAEFPEAFK